MVNITTIAKKFFEACEAGKGWAVCGDYCTPDATFSAKAEPLEDVQTLCDYTECMKRLLGFMPDGSHRLNSFATDDGRESACAYGVFSATHTGEGGPCPPTDRSTNRDYVYVMQFQGTGSAT